MNSLYAVVRNQKNPLRLTVSRLLTYRQLATQKIDNDGFFNDTNAGEDVEFDITTNIPDAEESMEREEKFRNHVEKMRDVSRFGNTKAELKYKMKIPTYSDNEAMYLKQSRYFRGVYAKYGKESGIEPGVAWPSKQELFEKIREENEYDLTLKQKINMLIERKQNEIDRVENLEKETDASLTRMPKSIEKYYQNMDKKYAVEDERKAKKDEIMEQAREYYGFKVDLRDKRIKDMVEKMHEEKKKLDKSKKKEEEKKKFQMMKQMKVAEETDSQTNTSNHESASIKN